MVLARKQGINRIFLIEIKTICMYSLRPLQLFCSDINVMIWEYPKANSTRFCRPIRFQFQKETSELAQLEKKYIEDQIHDLQPILITCRDREIYQTRAYSVYGRR